MRRGSRHARESFPSPPLQQAVADCCTSLPSSYYKQIRFADFISQCTPFQNHVPASVHAKVAQQSPAFAHGRFERDHLSAPPNSFRCQQRVKTVNAPHVHSVIPGAKTSAQSRLPVFEASVHQLVISALLCASHHAPNGKPQRDWHLRKNTPRATGQSEIFRLSRLPRKFRSRERVSTPAILGESSTRDRLLARFLNHRKSRHMYSRRRREQHGRDARGSGVVRENRRGPAAPHAIYPPRSPPGTASFTSKPRSDTVQFPSSSGPRAQAPHEHHSRLASRDAQCLSSSNPLPSAPATGVRQHRISR